MATIVWSKGRLFSLFLLFIITCSSMSAAHGQANATDTAFVKESVGVALRTYKEAIANNAHLYTGKEYADYRKPIREGHQFFNSDAVSDGDIVFEGALYKQIPILYDVVLDKVVIVHSNSIVKQELIQEKVNSFRFQEHTFIRYHQDSLPASIMSEGFYDLLFQGKITLLAKRGKMVENVVSETSVMQVFKSKDLYYIRKENLFHQIKGKRSLYNLLKEQKKELRKFANTNRLNYKEQKEEYILALTKHYNSLVAE